MCGRYYIEADEPRISSIVSGAARDIQLTTGEVFPTNTAPVIAPTGDLAAMRWGFTRYDGRGEIINARSETAAQKPMFSRSMVTGRCLIPASWYFEWEKRGTRKIKYALRPSSGRVLYMAGLSRMDEKTGAQRFVILTRAAWSGIAFIHDRMPVIFPEAIHEEWLFGRDPTGTILRAVEQMEYTAV